MFSSEGNISEAARVCWCCQLCLTLVTELSAQRCSHLRSWQPTAVSEQQTHFTITPLSLTPPSLPPFLLISFDIPPLFTHLICCFFSSSALVSLSRLPYFHTCAFPSFIVWFCCQPSTLTEHTVVLFFGSPLIFSLNFPSCLILWLTNISSLCLHILSPPLTSQQLPFFTVCYLKLCFLQRWQEKNIRIKEQDCCSCGRHISLFFRWYCTSRWHTMPQHLSVKQLRGLSS